MPTTHVRAVARNPQRVQPLHAAVAGPGPLSLVEALLEAGAAVDARQQRDVTPLHTAAQRGEHEVARLLLEHGADPTAADEAGRSPLDLARAEGHEAVTTLLVEASAPQ